MIGKLYGKEQTFGTSVALHFIINLSAYMLGSFA